MFKKTIYALSAVALIFGSASSFALGGTKSIGQKVDITRAFFKAYSSDMEQMPLYKTYTFQKVKFFTKQPTISKMLAGKTIPFTITHRGDMVLKSNSFLRPYITGFEYLDVFNKGAYMGAHSNLFLNLNGMRERIAIDCLRKKNTANGWANFEEFNVKTNKLVAKGRIKVTYFYHTLPTTH